MILKPLKRTVWLCCACMALVACATKKAPPLIGAVTPLEGGQYKSFVKAQDEASAMKMLTHDGNVTCQRDGKKRFVVVSQDNARKDAPDVKTENKFLDAAVSLSSVGKALRGEASFEAATVFRCE